MEEKESRKKERKVSRLGKRLEMALGAGILFLTELLIGLYGKGYVRAYLGDVLIIPFLYCVIGIFVSKRGRFLPAGLFCLGLGAEILQALDLCGRLGIEKHSFWGILLGSTGDGRDVVCYGMGALLIYGAAKVQRRMKWT